MSLLREIQKDIGNPALDVPTLMLKCKILAARLGSQEFAKWLDMELNGYQKDQSVPDYRRFGCIHYASYADAAFRYPKEPRRGNLWVDQPG